MFVCCLLSVVLAKPVKPERLYRRYAFTDHMLICLIHPEKLSVLGWVVSGKQAHLKDRVTPTNMATKNTINDQEEELFAKARAWMDVILPSGQKQGDSWEAEPPEELRDYVTSLIWQDEKDWERLPPGSRTAVSAEHYIENGGEMIEYYRWRRAEKKALASTPEALAAKAAQKAEKEAARAAARACREAQKEALKAAAAAQKEAALIAQKAAADRAALARRVAAGERCSPRLRAKAGL